MRGRPEFDAIASRRTIYRLWLVASWGILLLLPMGKVTQDGQGIQFRWGTTRMPETCIVRRWWGWSCPGCGVTRSLLAIVNCEWRSAYQINPAGFVVASLLVWQCLFRPYGLNRLGEDIAWGEWVHHSLLFVLVVVLAVRWILLVWENLAL